MEVYGLLLLYHKERKKYVYLPTGGDLLHDEYEYFFTIYITLNLRDIYASDFPDKNSLCGIYQKYYSSDNTYPVYRENCINLCNDLEQINYADYIINKICNKKVHEINITNEFGIEPLNQRYFPHAQVGFNIDCLCDISFITIGYENAKDFLVKTLRKHKIRLLKQQLNEET